VLCPSGVFDSLGPVAYVLELLLGGRSCRRQGIQDMVMGPTASWPVANWWPSGGIRPTGSTAGLVRDLDSKRAFKLPADAGMGHAYICGAKVQQNKWQLLNV
jgi:hypothetical protein